MKPSLALFGRRPDPDYEDLVAQGVSAYALLGPWHADHGRGVREPVSLSRQLVRASHLRERGIEVELLVWPPYKTAALDRWLGMVRDWCAVLRPSVVHIDHEPASTTTPGRRIVTSAVHARMVYVSVRAAIPPHTRIACTHVAAPRSAGLEAGLEAAHITITQCYGGSPHEDARRIEQAHRAAPENELRVAMPTGFKAAETETELRAYVPVVLAADAPISQVMIWPKGGDRKIEAWEWQVYAEHTQGRLVSSA